MIGMRSRWSVALALSLSYAPTAEGLMPVGSEFFVGSNTTSNQICPKVATADDGSSIVVWSAREDNRRSVRAQIFDAQGSPKSDELLISDLYAGCTHAVAAADDGSFVVTWQGSSRVRSARYDAVGNRLEPPFEDTYYSMEARGTDLAASEDAPLVVVWGEGGYMYCSSSTTTSSTTSTTLALGARASQSAPLADARAATDRARTGQAVEFAPATVTQRSPRCSGYYWWGIEGMSVRRVDTPPVSEIEIWQTDDGDSVNAPQVAGVGRSGFHVVWETGKWPWSDVGSRVTMNVRDHDALGREPFEIHTDLGNGQEVTEFGPSITMNRAGESVVGWTAHAECHSGSPPQCEERFLGAQLRRFDLWGNELPIDSPANAFADGTQRETAVGGNAAGDTVVVWTGSEEIGGAGRLVDDPVGASDGIFARGLDCNGNLMGDFEHPVNETTAGDQDSPAVAVSPGGDAVVAWRSTEGDRSVIKARRFRLDAVCTVCGDVDGDGKILATDALTVLRRSIDLVDEQACPPPACNARNTESVTSSDALAILQWAVGVRANLDCPREIRPRPDP